MKGIMEIMVGIFLSINDIQYRILRNDARHFLYLSVVMNRGTPIWFLIKLKFIGESAFS